MKVRKIKIGVAIASFNSLSIAKNCIETLPRISANYDTYIVLVDDGSTDNTGAIIKKSFEYVTVLFGNGNLWWAGGTNEAIKNCLENKCDYILLLNPDVTIGQDTIKQLLLYAKRFPNSILAPVVVSGKDKSVIWWAGSTWGRLSRFIPFIMTSRYIYKSGASIEELPNKPYISSECHGRGVLVPKHIFEDLGLYDAIHFPHYGADTDFSFRAWAAGYSIHIAPDVLVCLDTKNTGMKPSAKIRNAINGYYAYLTKRKNGEALFVWWHLTRKHLPFYQRIPTFVFIIVLNTLRYWHSTLFKRKYI